jgi:hypothetical protein
LYTREGAEKTGFPRFSPAPCYILVGINWESIICWSPPCFLLVIQWNHSIRESRSRAKESGSGALPNGVFIWD